MHRDGEAKQTAEEQPASGRPATVFLGDGRLTIKPKEHQLEFRAAIQYARAWLSYFSHFGPDHRLTKHHAKRTLQELKRLMTCSDEQPAVQTLAQVILKKGEYSAVQCCHILIGTFPRGQYLRSIEENAILWEKPGLADIIHVSLASARDKASDAELDPTAPKM